jgi:hypothetical protein
MKSLMAGFMAFPGEKGIWMLADNISAFADKWHQKLLFGKGARR